MSVFHQMGYQSNNLIYLPELSKFAGAIFSPINSRKLGMQEEIGEVRSSRSKFEIIFDPQLYVPSTSRGDLKKWPYFPKDMRSEERRVGKECRL